MAKIAKQLGWLTAVLATALAAPAGAQDFWEGKSLTVIVGTDAGGGYDTYGRTVGRFMVKYLPRKPTMIAQNMTGAGSKRAAEHMATLAPKDGATIAIVYPGAIADPLTLDRSKWRYDPTRFEFIGTADSGTRMCSTRLESSVKTFEDAKRHVATIGASAPGGSTFDYPTMLNALAGTKFKIVGGYKATVDIALAFDRGEVDGWCGVELSTYMAVRPQWLTQQKVNTIVQIGMQPDKEMSALGIPSIWPFVPSENRKVMELIVGQQEFQRPFIAPPGTPAARVQELRNAFMSAVADTELLAEAAKMKLSIAPRSGGEVARLVASMYATPPDLIARMALAIKPN